MEARIKELLARIEELIVQYDDANDSHQRFLIEFVILGLRTRVEHLMDKLEEVA